MDENKLSVVLSMTVPKIIELILENSKLSELEATEQFYSSRVYALLEEEETKLWHLSPLTLYNMYEEEQKQEKLLFRRRRKCYEQSDELFDFLYGTV